MVNVVKRHRTISLPWVLFMSALLVGCSANDDHGSDQEEHASSHRSIQLVKDFEVGTQSDLYFFGAISDIAADSKGNIYVADVKNFNIQVFSETGEHLRSIGEEGRGPSEFKLIWDLEIGDNDILYAFDRGLRRISVFATEDSLRLLRTMAIPGSRYGGSPNRLWAVHDEGLLISFSVGFSIHDLHDEKRLIVRTLSTDGILGDEVLNVLERDHLVSQSGSNFSVSTTPFGREPVIRTGPDNKIYYGRNDSLRIGIYSQAGELLRTIRHDDTIAATVSEEEFARRLKDYRITDPESIESIPKTWPIFETFVLDDEGKLWVAINTEEYHGGSLWWVLDQEGRKIAEVTSAEHVHLKAVRNGHLYGHKVDESGVQSLVQYRIVEESKTGC